MPLLLLSDNADIKQLTVATWLQAKSDATFGASGSPALCNKVQLNGCQNPWFVAKGWRRSRMQSIGILRECLGKR